MENRRRVVELTGVPVAWLEQVHGAQIEDAGAVDLQPLQRADLILSHEAAVPDHVGSKYSAKPPLHALIP